MKYVSDDGQEFTMMEPLAYRGKKGCRDVCCTRAPFATEKGMCYGWHCVRCHAPCSMQGHKCPEAVSEG